MSRFASAVAIVTGAGSGIGRAVARRWVDEGGRVLLIGRTREKLDETRAEFGSDAEMADRAIVAAGDHGDEDFATRAVRSAIERFGRVDFLFNNAGVFARGTLAELDTEHFREIIDANLIGPLVMTRAALPWLRESRGVVIYNASTLGLRPVPGAAAYAIAKAGLVMLAKAAALEEAPYGVRVNAVCPGVVDTPIHRREDLASMASAHPLGRVGSADEVAALVLHMASRESAWMTGSVVTIDGGISLA